MPFRLLTFLCCTITPWYVQFARHGVTNFAVNSKKKLIGKAELIFILYLCRRFPSKEETMCSLEPLKIDLKGLKEDETVLAFDLGDGFFQALDGSQLEHGTLHVSVSIRKMTGFFDLHIHSEGSVTVSCDRCLDDMSQPVEANHHLTVLLGDTYQEEDDTVTIAEHEGILDVSWFIYESVMLAIPIKHVHAPGKCNSAMTQKLTELSGAVRSGEEEAGAIDPRWEALAKLKV